MFVSGGNMMGHRRGTPFIRYALPVWLAGKPPKPPEEQEGKGKPRPITTLAVGEEGGSGAVTSMAVGEEGGNTGS
jgi:hypothetical protein